MSICSVTVCDLLVYCKELCIGHYARAKKGQPLDTPIKTRKPNYPSEGDRKRCNECKEVKPIDCFYLHSTSSDGYRSQCIECHMGQRKESRRLRITLGSYAQCDSKRCYQCQQLLPASDFPNNKHNPDGLGSACRSCSSQRSREWREQHPERHHESVRRWVLEHPDRNKALQAKRRLKLLEGTVEETDLDSLWRASGGICYLCNTEIDRSLSDPMERGYLNWDHIIPLARGGSHCSSNLKPTHRWCNYRKWVKLPSEMELPLLSPHSKLNEEVSLCQ